MKPIRLEIKESKKINKKLTLLGRGLIYLGFGILLFCGFILKLEIPGKVGITVGFMGILLIIVKDATFALQNKGEIVIVGSTIKLLKQRNNIKIDIEQLSEVELYLEGWEGMSVKNTFLGRDTILWGESLLFGKSHGHKNKLIFKQKNEGKINSHFYLSGEHHERVLKKHLKGWAENQNIKLKITYAHSNVFEFF